MICGQVPLTTSGMTVMTGAPQLSIATINEISGGGTPAAAQTVRPAAHWVMTGAVVSLTVISWVAVAVLPQLSVAVQVRVIRLLQSEPGLLCVSVGVTVNDPSQLSVAVKSTGGGTSLRHCTVRLPGTPLNSGAKVSPTVMVCTQDTR